MCIRDRIVTETGGTNDRYTKLSADPNSTIDVIELSQAMTAKGTDEGLFDTIDLSKIPNAEKLIPAAKEIAEAGQGVPYTINSIGIIYNPELTGFDITSFDDLWDERLAGKVSIPEITTTFGPAMVYVASDHAGVDVTTDNGEAAFKALADLKPNLVKTYTKSSDLLNMFTSCLLYTSQSVGSGNPWSQEIHGYCKGSGRWMRSPDCSLQ